jgi:hypothetical protein
LLISSTAESAFVVVVRSTDGVSTVREFIDLTDRKIDRQQREDQSTAQIDRQQRQQQQQDQSIASAAAVAARDRSIDDSREIN